MELMMLMRSILDFAGEDGVELLLGDEAVVIDVGPGDELLEFLLGDVFSKLLGNSAQVFDGNEASALIIKQSEDLVNVGPGVLVVDSGGHEGEPLGEINGPVAVGIEIGDHLEDGSVFGLEPEGSHGSLKL